MAKTKYNYAEIDPHDKSLSRQDLLSIRRQLAKRANQRLVRLERGSFKVTGEDFTGYGAYKHAMVHLEASKQGTRFKESINYLSDANPKEIRDEIKRLQTFLHSKTSTVAGHREIEKMRIKTFESGQWGLTEEQKARGEMNKPLHFSDTKEFYDFLNSKTFEDLKKHAFTSEQLIEIYDEYNVAGNEEKTIKAFEAALEEFRAQGNASFKSLTSKMKKLKKKETPKKTTRKKTTRKRRK